jgi:hypothetical protein
MQKGYFEKKTVVGFSPHSMFVLSLIFERGKKCYCVKLMKLTVVMQHIA